jgi:hypothetical protein
MTSQNVARAASRASPAVTPPRVWTTPFELCLFLSRENRIEITAYFPTRYHRRILLSTATPQCGSYLFPRISHVFSLPSYMHVAVTLQGRGSSRAWRDNAPEGTSALLHGTTTAVANISSRPERPAGKISQPKSAPPYRLMAERESGTDVICVRQSTHSSVYYNITNTSPIPRVRFSQKL